MPHWFQILRKYLFADFPIRQLLSVTIILFDQRI